MYANSTAEEALRQKLHTAVQIMVEDIVLFTTTVVIPGNSLWKVADTHDTYPSDVTSGQAVGASLAGLVQRCNWVLARTLLHSLSFIFGNLFTVVVNTSGVTTIRKHTVITYLIGGCISFLRWSSRLARTCK